jgi:hypothetical protein
MSVMFMMYDVYGVLIGIDDCDVRGIHGGLHHSDVCLDYDVHDCKENVTVKA